MRASGFSINKIINATLATGFLIIIAVSLLGETAAPALSRKAEINKLNEQNAGQAVVTAGGEWIHVGNNFIHVQHVIDRTLLEGVTRYQFDTMHRLQVAYYAKSLSLKNDQWLMKDVVKTEFYPERTRSQSFKEAPWDVKFNLSLLNTRQVEPANMTLPRLVKYAQYLKMNGLQASAFEYNFWQRILQPVAALIMIFLAIPFVLSTLQHLHARLAHCRRHSGGIWILYFKCVAGTNVYCLSTPSIIRSAATVGGIWSGGRHANKKIIGEKNYVH